MNPTTTRSRTHSSRHTSRLGAFALATAVVALFGLGLPEAALAHDQLIANSPSDNEVLAEAPEEVVLNYNNSILDIGEGATIVNVVDADGADVTDGSPVVNGPEVAQPLAELGDGAYQVTWRVVSSDGHPISGTFAFAVGADGEDALASLAESLEADGAGDDPAESALDEPASDDEGAAGMSVPMMLLFGVGVIAIVVLSIVLMRRKSAGPPAGGEGAGN